MTEKEKIEFAKQQINIAISSGKRKEDVYSIVLNTANNIDLANSLFQDVVSEDFQSSAGILKSITNEPVKERLEESFFSYLENNPISNETILGLFTLGRAYQEKYFLEKKELLDELYKIDDYAYDALIKKEEHLLYINYIELCYEYTGIIPKNTEKLIQSDIKANTKIQEEILKLETEMYECNDFDNLFYFATFTNTLDNIKQLFACPAKEIYIRVAQQNCSPKTCYYAYFLYSDKSELEQKLEWYGKNIIINQPTASVVANLILTRYQIRLLEIENKKEFQTLKVHPLDTTKKCLLEFTEEEQYDLFLYHAKLFNKLYRNSEKYLELMNEDHKWNPFKANETIAYQRVVNGKKIPQTVYEKPVINFRKNPYVQNYLEKEKDVLRQEAIEFAKNVTITLDTALRLYFTTILHYAISFSEYIENLKFHKRNNDFFLIYNTLFKGIFRYEKEELLLETEFGKVKVAYTDESNSETKVVPGELATVNVTSYGFTDKNFRILNIIPIKNNKHWSECVEISRDIRRGEKETLSTDKLQNVDFIMELCRIDPLIGVYCYLKNTHPTEELKNRVEEILHFKVDHLKEENILTLFYQYALKEDKNNIQKRIVNYIQMILDKYEYKSTSDLTGDKGFNKFRTNTSLVFTFLEKIDSMFYQELMKELEEKDLLSITYWNVEGKDYYKKLLEEEYSYIREFYKVYPIYTYSLEDIIEISKVEKEDVRLYLYLKELSVDIQKYNELEGYIRKSLKEDNRFVEWIKRIDLNIPLMGKTSLLNPLKGLPYNAEIEEENKDFIELAQSLFVYEDEPVVGNTLKEVLESINYNISEERLEKIEELSSIELTKNEKLEIAPIIIEVLENSNCSPKSRLSLLKTLGKNNPFDINGEMKKSDFDWIERELNIKLNAIAAAISPEERIDLYFLSPQHLIVELLSFVSVNKEKALEKRLDYYLRGTVNVTNFGNKMTIYPTNVECKENHMLGEVKDLKTENYRIIPHYDELSFRIVSVESKCMRVETVLDFEKEEEQWRKSVEDRSYYESLYREEKEKVLMHYCRKDVSKAYEFDKEGIIPRETYLDISKLISTYTLSGIEHLYFTLILGEKSLFIERLLKANRILERQYSLLKLQEKILEEKNIEAYERLILYLKDLSYLHDYFLLDEAKEFLENNKVFQENYKKYNKDGFVEKSLITDNIEDYIDIKLLEYEKIEFSKNQEKVEAYIKKCLMTPFPTEKEIAYNKYITYKNVVKTKEIPQEYFEYWKEKEDSEELFELLNQRLLNDEVKKVFSELESKATSYEDYEKIIIFARPFLFLKEDAEIMILKDEKLYPLKETLKRNRAILGYYDNRLQLELNTLRWKRDCSLTNIASIEFVGKIVQKAKQYWKLDRKEELSQLVDFMLSNNIPVKAVIHSDEIFNTLEESQRERVYNQSVFKKNVVEKAMRNIRSYYDLEEFLKSSTYAEWKELQHHIEAKTIDSESLKEEIRIFEENLEQDQYNKSWRSILIKKLEEFNLPIEKYLFTQPMKDTYKIRIDTLEKDDPNTYTDLYKICIEQKKSKVTTRVGKIRRIIKAKRFVKETAFDKELFQQYYELYATSKLLYKNKKKTGAFIEALLRTSILNSKILYEKISLENIPEEETHSKKTELIDADRYLLENIQDFNQIDKIELIKNAKEEDQYYIYLALCYWDKEYIDYPVPIILNEDCLSMISDFMTITLYAGVDPIQFLESLKENNILNKMDEETKNRVYKNAVINAMQIMEMKKNNTINNRMLSVMKKNPCPTEKENLKFTGQSLDILKREYIEIIESYINVG